MNLSNINYGVFFALTLITIPVFLLSFAALQSPEKKIKKIILKALNRKFRVVKQISETEFVGLPEFAGVNFYSTADSDKILVFRLHLITSPRKILKLVKEFLERKGFRVEFYYVKKNDILAIMAYRKSIKVYIGIVRGRKISNSFLIRIES
jgi:hypothetical protein